MLFTTRVILATLIPFACSSDIRHRIETNQEPRKKTDFSIATTSKGTTKVIVQVKNDVVFILDDSINKTSEVKLDDTSIIGIEVDDISKIDSLYDDPNVVSIEPDYPVEIFEEPHHQHQRNFEISNDTSTRRNLQDYIPYGIDMVLQNRQKFLKMKAKGKVNLCIVDSGYDLGHQDLPRSPNVIGEDAHGERWSYDGNSHGTHVAGIVAALANNGGGVYGVVPKNYGGKFKLLITKAFDSSGSGSNSDVLDAVKGCVSMGANIITMSLGCISSPFNGCYSYAFDAYTKSLYDKDILLLAAAGNAGTSELSYPASYESVISVASITSTRSKSSFSQFNQQVELSAPGSDILSTVPNNDYDIKSGTSMATPYVAGVAALLRLAFPKCSAVQIRKVMAWTARDIESKGCDIRTGFGLVQANNAFLWLRKRGCNKINGTANGGCYKLTKASRKKKRNKNRAKRSSL